MRLQPLTLSSLACATLVAADPATLAGSRPNIVLLIADDMDWQSLGCMGDPAVRTPRLDALAAEGLVLTQVFTPATTCAPCRTALMTGCWPMRSGSVFNHPKGLVRDGTPTLPQQLLKAGYRVGVLGKIDLGPVAAFPFELIPETKDMESISQDAVRSFLTRDPAQPFCFIYGSGSPHGPWKGKRAPDASPTDPATVAVPPTMADTPETRIALAAYADCVGRLDWQCGRVLDLVRDCGLDQSTLTIFNSEQGREVPWGKYDAYDDSMRSTTIVRWPGKVGPGSRNNALCATIDLLPTLIEVAGGTAPATMDGRSLLPVLAGSTTHRDAVFGYGTNCQRSVRTRTHALIRTYKHAVPISTYVNHPTGYHSVWWKEWQALATTDATIANLIQRYTQRPYEVCIAVHEGRIDPARSPNLVDDPTQVAIVADLRGRLDRWMAELGDTGLESEQLLFSEQGRMLRNGAQQHHYSSPREAPAGKAKH